MSRPAAIVLTFATVVLLGGCRPAVQEPEAVAGDAGLPAVNPPAQHLELPTVPAEPLTRTVTAAPFQVVDRLPSIRQFPCTSCHQQALPVRENAPIERGRTHANIELNHGPDGLLSCAFCHDSHDPGQLHRIDGEPVAINHAYQLCGQCHMNQAQDWTGGAHGKRLTGWGYERVVLSCPACHDPHAPAVAPRWPVTFPTLPDPPHDNLLPEGAP